LREEKGLSVSGLIPVNLLTGFLGSGKTTLLQRLLRSPGMANTAVLINEFGEVALDHLLIGRIDASTVVLESGCICCTVRSDVSAALRDLYSKAERGLCRKFDRTVIETTGLADPAPIIYTLMTDPVIRHHFRLSSVIATVDAVNGARQFAENRESVKQAAVADRLVLTKTDLATPRAVETMRSRLAAFNPSAQVVDANNDAIGPALIFGSDFYDPSHKTAEVRAWLDEERQPHTHQHTEFGRHAADITSFHLVFESPLDWTAFGIWLTMLLNRHGERVLRIKGILNVAGSQTPLCVNGVQHLVHPPFHLERWPTSNRQSRLVFIVRDIDPAVIKRSLLAFNRLSAPADAVSGKSVRAATTTATQ
jgi:G3E family GTPase